jgi:DNA-binding MarR family transcriptional regulator
MASKETLAEKEFALIREIAKNPSHTQRTLSQEVGLSLGTTNLLIQRLARKGYIKINQLDWKRTQYLLTLKGAMEKTQKVFDYTRYTMRLFKQIQANIVTAVRAEYDSGRREFTVVAQDELLELIRETVRPDDFPGATFSYLTDFSQVGENNDLLLTATKQVPPADGGRRYVSLVDFDNVDFRLS